MIAISDLHRISAIVHFAPSVDHPIASFQSAIQVSVRPCLESFENHYNNAQHWTPKGLTYIMLTQLFIAGIALLVPYFYSKIRHKRLHQYAGFPQLPTSLVLGHLQTVDEFVRSAPPKAHPGTLNHVYPSTWPICRRPLLTRD